MLSETDNVLIDEERRLASHRAIRTSIEADVNARLQSESEQLEPAESSELADVAHELKHQAVQEAVETERELRQGRSMARVSQVVTYVFYPDLRRDRLAVLSKAGGRARQQWLRAIHRQPIVAAAGSVRAHCGNTVVWEVAIAVVLFVCAVCLSPAA